MHPFFSPHLSSSSFYPMRRLDRVSCRDIENEIARKKKGKERKEKEVRA